MNRYFKFLSNIVGSRDNSRRAGEYDLLLKQLHRIEFYSLVPNDDNRGEDGKKLREIYLDEFEEDRGHIASSFLQDVPEGPCTVFEMLVGLSFRMQNELEGGRFAKKVSECFWILIENLDLAWCDNREWVEKGSSFIVEDKIQTFLDRKYYRTGVGGLFPMVNPSKNQTTVEIWYQMCEYLIENYDF